MMAPMVAFELHWDPSNLPYLMIGVLFLVAVSWVVGQFDRSVEKSARELRQRRELEALRRKDEESTE
jgi:hypothetical protein